MKVTIGSDANNGIIKYVSISDSQDNQLKLAIAGNSCLSILTGEYPLDWVHMDFPYDAQENTAHTVFNSICSVQNLSLV